MPTLACANIHGGGIRLNGGEEQAASVEADDVCASHTKFAFASAHGPTLVTREVIREELHTLRVNLVRDLLEEFKPCLSSPSRESTTASLADQACQFRSRASLEAPSPPKVIEAPMPPAWVPGFAIGGHGDDGGNFASASETRWRPSIESDSGSDTDTECLYDPTQSKPGGVHGLMGSRSVKAKSRRRSTGSHDIPSYRGRSKVSKVFDLRAMPEASASPVLSYSDIGETLVAIAITANGLTIGLQTDWMAKHESDTVPTAFSVLELLFCIIFTSELSCKLFHFGSSFFFQKGWYWNLFDTFLVVSQLVDLLMDWVFGNTSSVIGANNVNIAFLRLLRVLRLMRIFRLFRLLHFFSELNVVAAAIANSLKSLVGTLILMSLLWYTCGTILCQISTHHRITLLAENEGEPTDEVDALRYWWGDLGISILSLFESILGGCDWDDVLRPLFAIHPIVGVLFMAYIAFVLLAMMNVITGIFVESAIQQAEKMKDVDFLSHVRTLYDITGTADGAEISREEFQRGMEEPSMNSYMKTLGIDADDANTLFMFLDDDNSGTIDAEELLNGLVRLRAGAKFLDVVTLLHEFCEHRQLMGKWMRRVDQTLKDVSSSPKSCTRPILSKRETPPQPQISAVVHQRAPMRPQSAPRPPSVPRPCELAVPPAGARVILDCGAGNTILRNSGHSSCRGETPLVQDEPAQSRRESLS